MKTDILFKMKSPLRDDFNIRGFRFGSGKPSIAIVGAMRGDEIQQQFVCSQLVKMLGEMEHYGEIAEGHEILVVPNANHFSMNTGKRFWAMDNTDINRMFPGYDKGETTQRIAAGLFENIKDYEYGVQLASFYLPGDFVPHIRMMQTGFEATDEGRYFGLPYVFVRKPRPYDTTVLNYNWQVWETKAFSLYCGQNNALDEDLCRQTILSILRFMSAKGIIKHRVPSACLSDLVTEHDLVPVKAKVAGLFCRKKGADVYVQKGDCLAQILHPYTGEVLQIVSAPVSGRVFFAHNGPLALQNTLLYHIVGE